MDKRIYAIDQSHVAGLALRLAMISTHYRKPKDWTQAEMEQSVKTLQRWWRKSIPCGDPPPLPVVEALCNDLNTPQAIAELHKLAKSDGRALFAGLKLMGLIPGFPVPDYGSLLEIKTIPEGHIPVEFGFETIGSV